MEIATTIFSTIPINQSPIQQIENSLSYQLFWGLFKIRAPQAVDLTRFQGRTEFEFSTMQAQLTQRDHDNLIKQKIEQDNQPEKSASETQKKRAACKC